AQEDMRELLDPEIARLTALQQKNPAVRTEEVEQLVAQRKQLDSLLNAASLRLDALRVIVAGGQE
ncbi:MAG: hypothetical protein GX029_13320, partial [Pseudomonadaceae bacterium]|nr:hypothetical protein [Pseudomonadaceae bacterium]